jgi:hypothetical protein
MHKSLTEEPRKIVMLPRLSMYKGSFTYVVDIGLTGNTVTSFYCTEETFLFLPDTNLTLSRALRISWIVIMRALSTRWSSVVSILARASNLLFKPTLSKNKY